MRSYCRKVLALVHKDVLTELRTKETILAMFIFAVLVMVVFNFALELRRDETEAVGSGVLWVAITFAGMLGLNRSFVAEKDKGCMEALLLIPESRSVLYLGKMLGNLIFVGVMELFVLPLAAVFLNVPVFKPHLVIVVVLGTIGFATVGTLFSAMAVNTRAREVLLPILFFPIVVPVIVAAVKATASVFSGLPVATILPWISLMAAFDVIFLTLSLLTFEFLVEE